MGHNQLSFYQTFHCTQLDTQSMDIDKESMISKTKNLKTWVINL